MAVAPELVGAEAGGVMRAPLELGALDELPPPLAPAKCMPGGRVMAPPPEPGPPAPTIPTAAPGPAPTTSPPLPGAPPLALLPARPPEPGPPAPTPPEPGAAAPPDPGELRPPREPVSERTGVLEGDTRMGSVPV